MANLTSLPQGLSFERPLEDLPLSLRNVKGTPEQITAVGECLAAAKDAPTTFSLPHLLGFAELCTAALQSTGLSLDLAMGIFHATKAMIDGRAVNVNRLGRDYDKLDAETRRGLASIQVNGVQLGLGPPFDKSETLPEADLPERLSPEDNELSLKELYAQMKRLEVLLVFKQKVQGLKLAVNPGFLIPKTDDLGLPRMNADGSVAQRAILNLSADVPGLQSVRSQGERNVNGSIDKEKAALEVVTLHTFRQFMGMWIRQSTAFPGILIKLGSFDLNRFYPSIDLAAAESKALGQ